ncbi:MAG: hypothetical protein ACKO2Z_26865, partial [Sphaerospermopsis kisseleviana]
MGHWVIHPPSPQSPVTSPQRCTELVEVSPVTSHQRCTELVEVSPVTSHQSPVTSPQSPISYNQNIQRPVKSIMLDYNPLAC